MTFPVLPDVVSFGPVSIHWYGLLVVVGMYFGYVVLRYLNSGPSHRYSLSIVDSLVFYLIIWGFVGARLYHVLNEPTYYWNHPIDIFKIWNGGLAVHGAIFAGVVVIWYFSARHPEFNSGSRKEHKQKQTVIASKVTASVAISLDAQNKRLYAEDGSVSGMTSLKTPRNDRIRSFFSISDLLVVGLVIGQAIGRWGNYFNQELFGKPTNGFFKVFIDIAHRPTGFENIAYYHPTFFYESGLNLVLFLILFFTYKHLYSVIPDGACPVVPSEADTTGDPESKQQKQTKKEFSLFTNHYSLLTCLYLVGYGLIRFFIDFLRIDPRPFFGGLYLSQWVSIVMIVIGVWIWYNLRRKQFLLRGV